MLHLACNPLVVVSKQTHDLMVKMLMPRLQRMNVMVLDDGEMPSLSFDRGM